MRSDAARALAPVIAALLLPTLDALVVYAAFVMIVSGAAMFHAASLRVTHRWKPRVLLSMILVPIPLAVLAAVTVSRLSLTSSSEDFVSAALVPIIVGIPMPLASLVLAAGVVEAGEVTRARSDSWQIEAGRLIRGACESERRR